MKTTSDFGAGTLPLVAGILRVLGFFGLLAVLTPLQIAFRATKPRDPFRISLLFYRTLLKVLGFRLRVHGSPSLASPTLYVSNHTSYLDVPVLGALLPAAFVAKAEVREWPMIGFLAAQQQTVFIERRAGRVGTQRNFLRERLEAGQSLVLFPEGTSSDGLTVLPFKSSLFSVVEEDTESGAPVTVQPVSVACTQLDGLPITRALRPFYAWYGDMTLVGHLWNVFKFGHFTIDVTFHAPVTMKDFADRKTMAQYCRQQVAQGVEQSLTGRRLAAGTAPAQLAAPAAHTLIGVKI